ncbi:MAG: hypothetical protein AAGJ81_01375 [Verrucomicrobiota bacterium]
MPISSKKLPPPPVILSIWNVWLLAQGIWSDSSRWADGEAWLDD